MIQYALSNSTVDQSTNGSELFSGFESKEVVLVVNVKAAPTGTSPTLTFTVAEVDPGDRSPPSEHRYRVRRSQPPVLRC
jgi:hypothetical protein